jgi:hypothetical protein
LVTVNGTVAGFGTVQADQSGTGLVLWSTLDPAAFTNGANAVRVYIVDGPVSAPVLREVVARH